MPESASSEERSPRISIIIPCYNSEEFIEETIECALSQDYGNKEILVIDDGSTDRSPEIIKKYEYRIRSVRQDNAGVSATRNHAIKIARGQFLQFLDSDDLILPGKLKQNIQVLQETGGDITIAEFLVLKDGKRLEPLNYQSRDEFDSTEEFVMYTSPLIGTCLYRADWVRQVGGFDQFRRGEDHLFQCKLLAAGAKFIHVPEKQFLYREHEAHFRLNSVSSLAQDPFIVKEKNQIIEKLFQDAGRYDDTVRKALSFNSYRHGLRYYGIDRKDLGDEYMRLAKGYWNPPVVGGPLVFRLLNRMIGCRRVGRLLSSRLFQKFKNLIRRRK